MVAQNVSHLCMHDVVHLTPSSLHHLNSCLRHVNTAQFSFIYERFVQDNSAPKSLCQTRQNSEIRYCSFLVCHLYVLNVFTCVPPVLQLAPTIQRHAFWVRLTGHSKLPRGVNVVVYHSMSPNVIWERLQHPPH